MNKNIIFLPLLFLAFVASSLQAEISKTQRDVVVLACIGGYAIKRFYDGWNISLTDAYNADSHKKHQKTKNSAYSAFYDSSAGFLFVGRYFSPIFALPSSLLLTNRGWDNAWFNEKKINSHKEKTDKKQINATEANRTYYLYNLKKYAWTALCIGGALNSIGQIVWVYDQDLYYGLIQALGRGFSRGVIKALDKN